MKTIKMLFFVAVAGLIALPACNDAPKDPAKRADEANEDKTETRKSENDAETLVDAATSDMMEIQSSQIAVTMGTQQSVKDFANMMIQEHQNMSTETKALAAKKGFTLPTALNADKMEDLEDMKKWAKGKEFDNKYIEEQVDMHQNVLDKLEKCMAATQDSDIKTWTEKAVGHVRMHLEKAKMINDQIDAIYK